MLTNIHVEHYKAFDNADIPIKPITVLLGANSVGKSSIIQLLLAMEQTAMIDKDTYKSCLKLYGSSVNLGSAENIFRKFDTKHPVSLTFTVYDEILLKKLQRLYDGFVDDIKRLIGLFPMHDKQKIIGARVLTKKQFVTFIKKIINISNKKENAFIKERILDYPLLGPFDVNYRQLLNAEDSQLELLYELLNALKLLNSSYFDYRVVIGQKDRSTLVLEGFSLKCNETIILSCDMNGQDISISSSYVTFDEAVIQDIKNVFDNSSLFSCFSDGFMFDDKQPDKCVTSGYVLFVVKTALLELRNTFSTSRINHVSPLRAHPKRYYMLDKANVTFSLDTLDGDSIAEVLKENSRIKRRVNKWLNNFKLSVDVEEFKEVIHHLKVKQNELNLDITDVGFGISQVLPIIIQGFLSRNDSLTMVEQPEIHLHPKMQADLADLFIDMVKGNKEKAVIIETHSEYLLRRLRRRISEGKIPAEQVSICLFHPQTQDVGAVIEHLDIAKKGFFKWPENFYDGELENDITEFIKNQA